MSEIDAEELPDYNGIVIGSLRVYFGNMASKVKRLIDDSISVRRKLEGKVGATFVTSRHRTGGKETTMLFILEAMSIYGMVIVGDPIEVGGHYGTAGVDKQAKKEAFGLGKRMTEIAEKL